MFHFVPGVPRKKMERMERLYEMQKPQPAIFIILSLKLPYSAQKIPAISEPGLIYFETKANLSPLTSFQKFLRHRRTDLRR